MTYIFGARCFDGVVLVGDTKVTLEEGAAYAYSKKLFKPFTSVVMGSSGTSGVYQSFQDRIITAVTQAEQEGYRFNIPEQMSVTTENVIRQMHDVYGEGRHFLFNSLNVLMAIRMAGSAELRFFTPFGFSEPVDQYKAIGHGEPCGRIFLKYMWNRNMTMIQTAKLGVFIIKFIQDMGLDNSVGFNDEFPPQVYYIPDVILPEQFEPEEEYEKTVKKIW